MNYYEKTLKEVGYVLLDEATQSTYDSLGFKSGLEVHQQLATEKKLFCNCPVGVFQDFDDYDAEVLRHMRPTLSELGEYDGTALMEFKTKKNITYRIKDVTTCTYETDDTPPFPMNRQALAYATEISLLLGLNIVGEVHIIRKQYLDGSIPTGFQRTAIIGIEGSIPIKSKNIRIMQLSIEEDSCREVSDIRHERIYTTDRLGTPLIETVTYPDMKNPFEVAEACQYIRFLARSTSKVRTGIGAGRQDVNVSCEGGTRIEIKGVAHITWIPQLCHNEVFRQWALLKIKDKLNKVAKKDEWKISYKELSSDLIELENTGLDINFKALHDRLKVGDKIIAVNLPEFKSILSHFTQPNKCFANELSDRLKVIACIEKPNILHSENGVLTPKVIKTIKSALKSKANDEFIIFWAPEEDIKTALETIEERCLMAFDGVPEETRKALTDGTTIFERVLPGADRMYPDTDSAPISISSEYIENIKKNLPVDLKIRMDQLLKWQVPSDCWTYILRNNLMPLIEKINQKLAYEPKKVATLLAHSLKNFEGTIEPVSKFDYNIVYAMLKFMKNEGLTFDIAPNLLKAVYANPHFEFDSALKSIGYKKYSLKELLEEAKANIHLFEKIQKNKNPEAVYAYVMGNIRPKALGNVCLTELFSKIKGQEA